MAKAKFNGKIIHVSNYKKRDKETKVETGELGWKVQLLFNVEDGINETSTAQYFPRADVYKGNLDDLLKFEPLENITAVIDVATDGVGFNQLLNVTKN